MDVDATLNRNLFHVWKLVEVLIQRQLLYTDSFSNTITTFVVEHYYLHMERMKRDLIGGPAA